MKLRNKELHDLYSTKHYLGHEMENISHVVEVRNTYRILLRNLKRSLYLGVYGRMLKLILKNRMVGRGRGSG
jgi:hypothetical protein